jgi:hypothetical protein
MAIQEQRTLPAPFIEDIGKHLNKQKQLKHHLHQKLHHKMRYKQEQQN